MPKVVAIMSETTKTLDYIATSMLPKKHAEIDETSTKTIEEKISFVNAVTTLMVHRDHIIRNTPWIAS